MDFKDIRNKISCMLGTNIIKMGEPMKNHTTFKVGGPADLFLEPETKEELRVVVKLLSANNIPFMILGNGSNLIVRDGGIRGCVISLERLNKVTVDPDNARVIGECGARLSAASNVALAASLKGLEFASGIPGTIGGAVTMNAGAYGPEIKDVLESVQVMNRNGELITLTNEQMDFSYRHSIIQKENYIVLTAVFRLEQGNQEEIRSRMNELNTRRSDKQPLEYPSAGSTFKRPEGHFAAKLIEDCGLKGLCVGGAMVSEKHSGFIINYDNATATDIINLIHLVQQRVFEQQGIRIETEVKIIGEEK